MLKMKAYRKSTFHKLYLIEPELYYKILPLLNELDKNELLQLNQKHSEEEMVIEEKNRDNMEKVESNSHANWLAQLLGRPRPIIARKR